MSREIPIPEKSILVRKIDREGNLRIVGDAPDLHIIATSMVESDLERGCIEVTVRMKTAPDEPDLVYELIGFEPNEPTPENPDPRANLSAWVCRRVEE